MKLPYAEVEFDKKGALVEPDQVEAAKRLIDEKRATDVIVVSHGWNNTHGDARAIYTRLIDSIVAVRGEVDDARQRRLVVVGVLWPSIQWAPAEDEGAGAGVGDATDALEAELTRQVRDPAMRRRLKKLVPDLETSSAARAEFVELLRSQLPEGATDDTDPDSAPSALATADPESLLQAARGGNDDGAAPAAAGGAASIDPAGLAPLDDGGGAGFDLGSIVDAARNVLNVTTYYTMKDRAGQVGENGIAKLLDALHKSAPDARLHLVGHSFGGRAVTAAAAKTAAPISSLSLLQAAYSHFGMAQKWDGTKNGLFWKVPGKVDGPIIVTFSEKDKAVGLAYPVASRIANQIGAGLGDQNDKYGGIGRNGALKTPASTPVGKLLPVGGSYGFKKGKVTSLEGSRYIEGHSWITGREVAYAVLTAIVTTP